MVRKKRLSKIKISKTGVGIAISAVSVLTWLLWPKKKGTETDSNKDATPKLSDTATDNKGYDLQYFDIAYIAPKNSGGQIVDDTLMEIRIAGEPPADTFPIGSEIILSGTGEDDGTYDLFEDIRGYSGNGEPSNPKACWLVVQHNTKAPVTGKQTPGATIII